MKKERVHRYPFSQLAEQLEGEVHTDALRRYMLSTDASIFKVMPAAVVYPASSADVQVTVRFAARQGLTVHPRGSGSGLCGAAVGDGIVLDFSRFMNRLLALDEKAGWFECQPGYRLGELEVVLAGSGLFFPPDPSSGEYASFGGMYNTNASGAHSVKYGNVADYLVDAEVVFADGSLVELSQLEETPFERLPVNLQQLAGLYREHGRTIEESYPSIACNVAGYNLRGLVDDRRLRLHRLLAGAEGSLAVVTRLKFRLIEKPPADALVVAYFDDIMGAAKAVQLTMPMGPSGIEIMDKSLLSLARASDQTLRERIPEAVDNVLLIEFDGKSAEVCAGLADRVQRMLREHDMTRQVYTAGTAREKAKFWAVRKAAVPILYKLKGRKKILALVEDAAVAVDRLVPYFEGIYDIFGRHGVRFVLYGHIAKGLMHTRPLLDLKNGHDVAMLKTLADEVYDLVAGLGGTVSGEHGDGRLRSAYLRRTYPQLYDLFQETKSLLDPRRLFNPDIKSADDPEQMTLNLRYGTQYRTTPLTSLNLLWPETFEGQAEKCHGCSKCTTVTPATRMCPVYKFTRDEAAAPKAKANVLRALLSGSVEPETLYQAGLVHVMAQCVNCGSCYAECPSNVNIPKLAMEAKAHFVSRYGADPVDHLTAGVELAARATHRLSPIIAPLVRRPSVRRLAARFTGLAAQREMVVFASRSLYQQVPHDVAGNGPSVLFYAGCYAAYIRPELGLAAIRVLERMGLRVLIPPQFCCGLPQISKGMVPGALDKMNQNLKSWGRLVSEADHIVVTCSSCGYALMKDWAYLADDHPLVGQISAKTVHISRLLKVYEDRLTFADTDMMLAYHHPCHLRIQPDADSSMGVLSAIPGIRVLDLKSHCCGIAGSWGMMAKNYDLSKAIGTPMTEKLNGSGARYGVTDCPTCQMQMEHLGNLPVRHPIEVVCEAMVG